MTKEQAPQSNEDKVTESRIKSDAHLLERGASIQSGKLIPAIGQIERLRLKQEKEGREDAKSKQRQQETQSSRLTDDDWKVILDLFPRHFGSGPRRFLDSLRDHGNDNMPVSEAAKAFSVGSIRSRVNKVFAEHGLPYQLKTSQARGSLRIIKIYPI